MLSATLCFILFVGSSLTAVSAQVQPAPNLRALPEVTNVKLGDNITLECATQGSATASNFLWFHGQNKNLVFYGEYLHDMSKKRHEVVSYSNKMSRISIKDVRFEDHGRWLCEASFGSQPKEEVETRLSIKSPPQWQNVTKEKSFSLHLRQSLQLNCTAEGEPAPTVTWTGDTGANGIILPDGTVTEYYIGNVLTLGNLTAGHSGHYYCRASNGISPSIGAAFVLKVPFAPVVVVRSSEVRARSNETFQIGCLIKAHPQVRSTSGVTWFRGSNVIPNDREGYRYSVNPSTDGLESTSILTTPKVDRSVEGRYRCEARNPHGSSQAEIRLVAGPAIKPDAGASRSGASALSSFPYLLVVTLMIAISRA